jgi:hypothetical protein
MVSYYQDPQTKLIYNKLTGGLAPPRFQVPNILNKREKLPSQQSSISPTYTPSPAQPTETGNILSSGTTRWYYVQKPSGVCERLKISENLKQKWEKKGWKISLTNICQETPKSGCSECESCDPMKIALGTCDCGVHCTERKKTKCYLVYGKELQLTPDAVNYYKNAKISITPCDQKPPQTCPTCPPNTIAKGSYGSILDPCRCEPPSPTPPPPSCECEACKNGTGECSDKRPCCNAWDLLCEAGGECSKPEPPPTPPDDCGCTFLDFGCKMGCWWEKYGTIVYVIGGLIGLGILLYLLRPLFSVIGSFKGGSP